MERYDIINEIVKKYSLNNYLEIGSNDFWCFDRVICTNKVCVDPGYETNNNRATYKMTSDDFFSKLENGLLDLDKNYKWNIIFIDGLHLSYQSYKDCFNSLKHLNTNGYIVLHDCDPPSINHAREDYNDHSTTADGWWNGTVWKTIQKIRTYPIFENKQLELITIDTDWGVGVLRYGVPTSILNSELNPFYEYNIFSKFRKEILNLVSIEEFKKWL